MSDAPEVKPVEAVPQAEKPTETPAEATASETNEEKTEEAKPQIVKTTAKHNKEDPRKNNKFDPSTREVTDDPVAIRKQVEFYFGDFNFAQDKFMWESCGGPENKPMPLKKITSFKRMQSFQPYSAVVAALKDSSFLTIAGEEGEETVQRKTPYVPASDRKKAIDAATVYVKGFGDEEPKTQFDLEAFFAKFGDVKGLKLRRTPEGLFKGSVFVTFADEEQAKKFLESEEKPKYNDNDLLIMSKVAYCDEKSELIRQGKLEPSQQQPKKFFEGNERGNKARGGGGNRRGNDRNGGGGNNFRGGRGRGNGRGGRGGRGNGRGGRGGARDGGAPKDPSAEDASSNKRGREEGAGESGEPAAKKVDTGAES